MSIICCCSLVKRRILQCIYVGIKMFAWQVEIICSISSRGAIRCPTAGMGKDDWCCACRLFCLKWQIWCASLWWLYWFGDFMMQSHQISMGKGPPMRPYIKYSLGDISGRGLTGDRWYLNHPRCHLQVRSDKILSYPICSIL